MSVMSVLGFALSHLAVAGLFAVVAVALGRRIAAAASSPLGDRQWGWGLPLALGLGAIGCAAALLGAAGLLNRPALILLVAAAACAAAPEWRPLLGEARALALGPRRPWALVAVVVAALPAALLALYPPTGFDALLYHLPAAARFAASGHIAVAPELRFPAFPWLNEVLFAAALRLGDDVLAQCVEWVAYAGTAVLLWEGCSRRFGSWAGALAAGLWLGDPLVGWLAASAYVEPLVALFLLAAVEALATAERAAAPRALLLAGGLAGCAAATKYQGLLAVALVGVWSAVGAPRGRRLRAALPPLAAAAAVALPWYLWIAAATGDPVFPILSALRHPHTAAGLYPQPSWIAVSGLPWGVWRQAVWPYPPASPLLWLLWPLPLLAWRHAPAASHLAVAALAMALIVAVAARGPDARLISVVGPLVAAAVAGTVAAWSATRWGAAAAAPYLLALALAALLPAWCYTALLVARRGAVPVDAAARESYLRRQLPGYAALSWLNGSCGRRCGVYGLWGENLRYYAAGRFVGDWYGPAPFGEVLRVAQRPPELHAFLASHGVDHLLVVRAPAGSRRGLAQRGALGDLAAGPWFRAEYSDGEAVVWALAGGGQEGAAAPRGGS